MGHMGIGYLQYINQSCVCTCVCLCVCLSICLCVCVVCVCVCVYVHVYMYIPLVQVNRQHLIRAHLNTLNTLLGILNMALKYEQKESNGLGASVAQQVLSVTGPILQEASIKQQVIVRSVSEEVSCGVASARITLSLVCRHLPLRAVERMKGLRCRHC